SLSPQFGSWQSDIVEAMVPPSVAQMTGKMTGQMIGRLLDGKYRLEELCGRGGMGAVYRALHVGTGRRVAGQVIAPELAGRPRIYRPLPSRGQDHRAVAASEYRQRDRLRHHGRE